MPPSVNPHALDLLLSALRLMRPRRIPARSLRIVEVTPSPDDADRVVVRLAYLDDGEARADDLVLPAWVLAGE